MTYEEALKIMKIGKKMSSQLEEKEAHYYFRNMEEATDIAIEALEKQIPKETIEDGYNGGACACPNCGWAFAFNKESKAEIIKMDMYRYCPECGQAIKWE